MSVSFGSMVLGGDVGSAAPALFAVELKQMLDLMAVARPGAEPEPSQEAAGGTVFP